MIMSERLRTIMLETNMPMTQDQYDTMRGLYLFVYDHIK